MPGSSNKSIVAIAELAGPLICGAAAFLMLVLFRSSVIEYIVWHDLAVTNLFNAVFGWAAIQTGCLFAIYGFVAGKTDGFIGEIRHTRAMTTYTKYVRRAMLSGFVLTVLTMPLIVYNQNISAGNYWYYLAVAFWFSLFLWAFLSFIRVAYIFGILVRIREPETLPGG